LKGSDPAPENKRNSDPSGNSVARRQAPEGTLPIIRKPWESVLQRITEELRQARLRLQAAAGVSPPGVIRALDRIEVRLARPLRVAIVGEFNSGKSSLANLLIRIEGLPTAVVSSTQIPTLLYHSAKPRVFAVYQDGRRKEVRDAGSIPEPAITRLEVGLPSPYLRGIEILDLPGLADPRFDRGIDDLMLPTADVLVWCTVSTQAWKESERIAWQTLPARLRRWALLVVTHSDLVRDAQDTHKLLRRLRLEAGEFRDILPVSTITALALLQGERDDPDNARWLATGADALDVALNQLLESVADRRIKVALAMIHRIARRALSSL
jgi:hypothetical protein